MSHIEEIPCVEVLSSVVFIIEGVAEESQNPQAIASHLNTCSDCQAEVNHEAPEELHRSIHEELLRQATGGAGVTEVVTQFSMTEISIEIDEFGNVEHREIQIEQTHVQHFVDEEDQK